LNGAAAIDTTTGVAGADRGARRSAVARRQTDAPDFAALLDDGAGRPATPADRAPAVAVQESRPGCPSNASAQAHPAARDARRASGSLADRALDHVAGPAVDDGGGRASRQAQHDDHAEALDTDARDTDAPPAGDAAAITAPDRPEVPGLLLALRQCLALLAPGADTAAPDQTASPATGGKTIAATPGAAAMGADAPTQIDASDALPAAPTTTSTADDSADPGAPAADLRFDALLAAMADPRAPPSADGSITAIVGTPATVLADARATVSAAPLNVPPMTLPPDHPQFVDSLGERIVWIADAGLGRGVGSAKIELHPLDLGSISVHVRMQGDAAQVSFAADNPTARALLADSLPQLRELLSVQGLQLLRAQVEQRVGTARAADTAFPQGRAGGTRDGQGPQRRVTRLTLVDAYA
jgi:flagellar hook-length control protein FliK